MLPEIFFGLNPKSIELRSVDYERIFNLLGMEHVGNASTCILSISLIQKRAFLYFYYNFRKNISRGHLISKCLFGVFTFFQKMNENKPTSSKVEFVRLFYWKRRCLQKNQRTNSTLLLVKLFSFVFWKKVKTPKRHFEIN